jgi:hypothetical protein
VFETQSSKFIVTFQKLPFDWKMANLNIMFLPLSLIFLLESTIFHHHSLGINGAEESDHSHHTEHGHHNGLTSPPPALVTSPSGSSSYDQYLQREYESAMNATDAKLLECDISLQGIVRKAAKALAMSSNNRTLAAVKWIAAIKNYKPKNATAPCSAITSNKTSNPGTNSS